MNQMKKRAYFDTYWDRGWPEPQWLEPYFLGPSGRRWVFETGNDGGKKWCGTVHADYPFVDYNACNQCSSRSHRSAGDEGESHGK